jgi:secreted trypsin-like serine protease
MSNICYGDSGGPMLYKIGNIWYLYGITSFTLANQNQSCNPIRPSFFTSVPNFMDWINENVKNHGSNRNLCFFNYIFLLIIIRMYK